MKLKKTFTAPVMTISLLFATASYAQNEAASQVQSEAVTSGNYIVNLKAETGFSAKGSAAIWAGQSEQGSVQEFKGRYSAKPELVSAATPKGKSAVRFNGAKKNPNQLKVKAVESYAVAEGESLSWIVVMKPSELTGANATYIQTTLEGRNYAWSMSQSKHGIIGEIRSGDGKRYMSLVPKAGLGGAISDWMVLTAVYDGGAKTFQLFLTDINGTLHSGNKVTSASLHSGAHKVTTLGSNTDRNSGAEMDLAEVQIYNSALNDIERAALEKQLYSIYLK